MTTFVSSGAARLAADILGTGPPVVFLHAGVADRRMWQGPNDAPSAWPIGRSPMTAARRGFGATRYAAEDHSHVADLLAVMDALTDGAPAALVGCSQGAASPSTRRWPIPAACAPWC